MEPSGVAALPTAVLVGVPFGALWAIAAADVLQRAEWEFPPLHSGGNSRIFWMFVVLTLSGFGALYYYLQVMKPHPRQPRSRR